MTASAVVLVMAFAAAAAALAVPPPAGSPPAGSPAAARPEVTERGLLLAVAVAATGLALVVDGTRLAVGLVALLTGAFVARLAARVRARRLAEERRRQVLEVVRSLAGELVAGQPPLVALAHGAQSWRPMATVAQAGRLGADVPAALRRLGDQPGAEGLRDVAAAWHVAESTGAGLAVALTRVAEAARERAAADRLVASELASAQATARLVAALPGLVLVLGSGLGGDPWGFLLDSVAGVACLAAGLLLMLAGLSWIERIASGVTGR